MTPLPPSRRSPAGRWNFNGENVLSLKKEGKTTYWSIFLAAGLAAAFFAAVHFFLDNYYRHALNSDKLEVITRQVRALKKHHRLMEKNRRVMAGVEGFLDQARSLRLTPDNWTTYDVNVQQPLAFDEIEKILAQAKNSDSHYFKPVMLQLHRLSESDKTKKRSTKPSNSASSPETLQKDLVITLQGAFLVRQM